jgi:hypothetical protein
MAISRFKERAEDAGDVDELNGLGDKFNVQQYWLRDVHFTT